LFQVEDYVVYGSSGVCKVLEIGTPKMHGIDDSKLYYKLGPVYSKGSFVYIPVENQVLREIISKEEAIKLIDNIPNIHIIQVPNDRMRDLIYKETMKKYDCIEWIKIIKTLYIDKQKRLSEGKKIGNNDMKYLHDAQDYLFGELSISLGMTKDKIEELIMNRFLC
jgi:CarD family transcriptional regulator